MVNTYFFENDRGRKVSSIRGKARNIKIGGKEFQDLKYFFTF